MKLDNYRTKGLRKKLIMELEQLGIKDKKVLDAFEKIPRHLFLDSAFLNHAYQNKAFPIGHGQTISHPYTVAFQTELLEIKKNDKVLEIGTGSGFQTCILSVLSTNVYTIERISELSKNAQKIVSKLLLKANFIIGDGSKGLGAKAPFDKIIVTAGAPTITSELLEQLAPLGKMVIPVGNKEEQCMYLIEKDLDNGIIQKKLTNFQFVPLIGENGW